MQKGWHFGRNDPPIQKRSGITNSEKYLADLCSKTFLSLWSYPSVIRNQWWGKELCDLLVVFGKDVLIFSDKDCAFENTWDVLVDWKRWYKKSILSSAKQLWGAERWIKEFPDSLFLDQDCTEKLPIELPGKIEMRCHLIAVAKWWGKPCKEYYKWESGSLVLTAWKKWNATQIDFTYPEFPFTIGDLDRNKTFVHVLDDVTLDILLKNLDTITDFVAYLQAKKDLFRRGLPMYVAWEENLLAKYLANNHSFPEGFPVAEWIAIWEGVWKEFQASPARRNQIYADKVSYHWDQLIEIFSSHALAWNQYACEPGDHRRIWGTEMVLRAMAWEHRTERRMLAAAMMDFFCLHATSSTSGKSLRRYVVRTENTQKPSYVFLTTPRQQKESYEEYREARRNLLMLCCEALKGRYPSLDKIVGLGFGFKEDGVNDSSWSEDACYLECADWSEEQCKEALEKAQKFGLLEDPRLWMISVERYPSSQKYSRNSLCFCGSGKKYKRCHWG